LAIDALKRFAGGKLIFIGERSGGCTGDDSFFNELENNWTLEKIVGIPRWKTVGIYDEMYFYTRK
jgi:hypothetical protein